MIPTVPTFQRVSHGVICFLKVKVAGVGSVYPTKRIDNVRINLVFAVHSSAFNGLPSILKERKCYDTAGFTWREIKRYIQSPEKES